MNSKSFKTEAEYTSPVLKVYNVKLQAVIATSGTYNQSNHTEYFQYGEEEDI